MPRGNRATLSANAGVQHICGECGYSASNETGFRLHAKTTHGKSVNLTTLRTMFQCTVCRKAFPDMYQLRTHARHAGHQLPAQ